ncbi:MAG TPA: SDR family NAD(P)-dependent oxidoreductase [Anaeromyxobacteraceae bacterium]|nr:SDR family NAD(P)-dependent oxidoreductase [Anaeromyxobacteraceae bacterium]
MRFRPRSPGRIDPVLSGLKAVVDHYRERDALPPLTEADRLDGRTCLVTGPSSGLGRAIAPELARRGGRVILACRAGHEGLAEAIRRETGSEEVSQRPLDLADLASVTALCDGLARDRVKVDVLVSNAGVAPLGNRLTRDGLAELFQVNFLSSFLLVNRLLADGVLPRDAFAAPGPRPAGGSGRGVSRVVITSSETHRQCPPIDFDRFGAFPDFGLLDGTTWYGHSKLYVQTFACELGRRLLRADGAPDVSVFSYCPGAVRTNISREGGFAGRVMTSYFIAPRIAMWPAIYCAASRTLEGKSRLYLYLRHVAAADARSSDPRNGERLWQRSLELLQARGISLSTLPSPHHRSAEGE